MSGTLRCRQCGAVVPFDEETVVQAAVERWIACGVLSPELAARLQGTVGGSSPGPTLSPPHRVTLSLAPTGEWAALRARVTPGLILLAVGGIFVVCAAVMVVSQFWNAMGPAGRALTLWGPTLALLAGGEALWRRERRTGPVAAVLLLVTALLAPFALWTLLAAAPMPLDLCCDLVGRADHGAARAFVVSALSVAVHLAMLARYRSPVLTLPAAAAWFMVLPTAVEWLGPRRHSGMPISASILVGGLALLAAGHAAAKRGKGAFGLAPDLVGSLAVGLSATVIGAEGGGAWEILAGATPLALIGAGCDSRRQHYMLAGTLFLILNIFRIGIDRFGHTVGMPITLLLCGLAAIVAGYAIHRLRGSRIVDRG